MNEPVTLRIENVTVGHGSRQIVRGASLEAAPGTVTTLIGPNGCGKSTLLRAIGGLSRPRSGTIRINGEDTARVGARALSRQLSMLPQSAVAPEGLTVRDLVARGRQPYQRWYRQWSPSDEERIEGAMETMDVLEFDGRRLDELSGGQRQRAWIAMCLAQDTPVLILDEPTTHLDIAHSVEILTTVRRLAHTAGRTLLMVLHDLSLAARYSDRLVVLAEGELRAAGTPEDILTAELLRDAFSLDARVFPDPVDGVPTLAPTTR